MDEVGIGRDAISAIVGHSDAERGARRAHVIRHYLKSWTWVARKAKALAIWEAHLGVAVVAGEVPVDNVVPDTGVTPYLCSPAAQYRLACAIGFGHHPIHGAFVRPSS